MSGVWRQTDKFETPIIGTKIRYGQREGVVKRVKVTAGATEYTVHGPKGREVITVPRFDGVEVWEP